MKRLILILAALPAFAQQAQQTQPCSQMNCYTASTGQVSLSSAATSATLQQAASSPYQTAYGIKASVYCSAACVVTRSYGGSKATATAGTVSQNQYQPFGPVVSSILFFTASNSSGGTTVDVTNVPAGSTILYDLSDVVLGSTVNSNYTIAIASVTATVNITFYVGIK